MLVIPAQRIQPSKTANHGSLMVGSFGSAVAGSAY